MRWIAVSLATCLTVSLAAFGWVALTRGEDDRLPQAQALTQAQASPPIQENPRTQPSAPAQAPPQTWEWPPRWGAPPLRLEKELRPRPLTVVSPVSQPDVAHVIAATMSGHTARYVLKEGTPAHFLTNGMTNFLSYFRFGKQGRKMVVRLLGGKGRVAWAAGYDGVGHAWVRARSELTGCGPIWYIEGRRARNLSSRARSADPPPCPLEPVNAASSATAATVLR